MLELTDLHVSVENGATGRRQILNGISLELETGKMYAITGPNGGGKSTLARAIVGITPADSGTIVWKGHDITDWPVDDRARLGVRYAFQQPPRFKGLSIKRLLELASGGTNDPAYCRALRQVGLCPEDYLARPVDGALSGGEMRRLEIAQMLVSPGDLLIFDEPEAGVDLWTFDQLLKLITGIHRDDPGRMSIVITHNEHFLRQADAIMLLAEGAIQAMGTPAEIMPMVEDELACKWRHACGGEQDVAECYRERTAE